MIPILFAPFALAAAAEVKGSDHLWPHVSYELLQFRKEGSDTSRRADAGWSRDDLLRKILETTNNDHEPLMEGWTTSESYAQLYWDHEVYFVFSKPVTSMAEVCRVVVTGLPETDAFPQRFSAGVGSKGWCSEPGRADIVPTPAQVRASWTRGRLESSAVFHTSQGIEITVKHIVGLPEYSLPLPPANVANVLTTNLLPTTLLGARRRDRRLDAVRLSNAKWGLLLKYEPTWLNLSGCFLSASKSIDVPSEAWITTEIDKWCHDRTTHYFASIPTEKRPMVPVIMGQPRKSWAENW